MPKTPGRPLPRRVEQIASTRISTDAKQLIVELLTLVQVRFGTVTELVKYAMSAQDKPVWAVGSVRDRRHVRKACSAVSKFLGSGAEKVPDWDNTAWIARACATSTELDTVLARLAGVWCQATGLPWPPGYTGTVDRGGSVETLTDPERAPDDGTRAQLYREQLRAAQATIEELSAERRQLEEQVRGLRNTAAHAGRRLMGYSGAGAADYRGFLKHARLVEHQAADRVRQVEDRVEEIYHHLAVLVAHLVSQNPPDQPLKVAALLPVSGLAVDTELRDLLDPPSPASVTPVARWLVVYLRTHLLLAHGHRITQAFPAIGDNLTAVVALGELPDQDVLDPLIRAHPMLRAYAASLLRAAHLEQDGHPTSLITVDTRTPTEQRLQDADTVQLGRPRRPVPGVRRQPRPSEQISVAELLARHAADLPPKSQRRSRRRRLPPTDYTA